MAYEDLCMYCFEDLRGENICPHCGHDNYTVVPQMQLSPRTLLYHDRFLIGRALGQDSSGIVYAAYDTKRDTTLRVREYLPRACAERRDDGSVAPIDGKEREFDSGLKQLRASVEGVQDPRRRHFFFETNGTAYIAQRRNGMTISNDSNDDDHEEHEGMKVGAVVIIVAVVVVLVVAVFIAFINGVVPAANDVTQNPTRSPENIWMPEGSPSPSPSPSATPTFKPSVDPGQSWIDYTYDSNLEEAFREQLSQSATVTPIPSLRPQTTNGSNVINSNSTTSEIRSLQQRLVTLGWLSYTNINGAYDSATRQAVRDFQTYVNSVANPNPRLSVDGVAGEKTQQWLYGADLVRPTPTPTPLVTPDPEEELTVDRNSSKTDILAVQRKLITLGLLPESSDNGVFGDSTTEAVKNFQLRVNELQGYVALPITGTVDPYTMAYLNFYVVWWENEKELAEMASTPTPTPTLTPTPTPTPDPTDIPNVGEEEQTVNASSDKESIQAVQQMLIGVGLMRTGAADGVYGSGTVAAVANFQEWINDIHGAGTLFVSGQADPQTLDYLEYYSAHGILATATPDPTDIPDVPENQMYVDKTSTKESVKFVQMMLINIGLLSEGSDDGLYGSSTETAVRNFQNFVNAREGRDLLSISGICDALTLSYLEEYSDSGIRPTPTPTASPTPVPTPEPLKIDLTIDGQPAPEGVYVVSGSYVSFTWSVQREVDSYYIYVTDEEGKDVWNLENTDLTSGGFNADELAEDVVYTIRIGALPIGGTESDMVWRTATFTRIAQSPETTAPASNELRGVNLFLDGVPASTGLNIVTGNRCTFSWVPDGSAVAYDLYIETQDGSIINELKDTTLTEITISTAGMTPGEVYVFRAVAHPVSGAMEDYMRATLEFGIPAPVVTAPPKPAVGVIGNVYLLADGVEPTGLIEVSGEGIRFNWGADGDVADYYASVDADNGQNLVSWSNTQQTQGGFMSSILQPGVIYTISIGARPTNGTEADIVWKQARFTVPLQVTPSPTPAPTVATVGKPSIRIDGTAYQKDGVTYLTGETVIFSWMATGQVEGYSVYLMNSAGQKADLGKVTTTSHTVSIDTFPYDVYRIYVGAIPAGWRTDEDIVWNNYTFGIGAPQVTQAPTQSPTPTWPPQIDATSDIAFIQQIQMKLYELRFLNAEDVMVGQLDTVTLRAVSSFQIYLNEVYDAQIDAIDPENSESIVDTLTLQYLSQAVLDQYGNITIQPTSVIP